MKAAPRRGWLLFPAFIALGILPAKPAGAFSVLSGVSDACHETITYRAGENVVFDWPMPDGVVPEGGKLTKLSGFLLEPLNLDPDKLDPSERFMLTSLIIGARAPDTDGHSTMNLENLHRLHGDPSAVGQYAHSLRGPDDDYAEGDAAAVAGTRQLIIELVEEGLSYLELPAHDQVIKAPVYLDFYGRVKVDVWAPLYLAGRAAHALQDSFSHAIRSDEDDLQKIVHVMNYIDAISSNFNEDRDGLAHSDAMDNCFATDLTEIFDASEVATGELLVAFNDRTGGQDPEATLRVLDRWLTLKPGCSGANGFCGNERWLELARSEQTGPYIKEIFGCSTAGFGSAGDCGASFLVLFFFILVVVRR